MTAATGAFIGVTSSLIPSEVERERERERERSKISQYQTKEEKVDTSKML